MIMWPLEETHMCKKPGDFFLGFQPSSLYNVYYKSKLDDAIVFEYELKLCCIIVPL